MGWQVQYFGLTCGRIRVEYADSMEAALGPEERKDGSEDYLGN